MNKKLYADIGFLIILLVLAIYSFVGIINVLLNNSNDSIILLIIAFLCGILATISFFRQIIKSHKK